MNNTHYSSEYHAPLCTYNFEEKVALSNLKWEKLTVENEQEISSLRGVPHVSFKMVVST